MWVSHGVGLGRVLRRAGVAVDSARMALGLQALTLIDIAQRDQVCHALEATWLSRAEDIPIFHAVFDAYWAALSQPSTSADAPGMPLAMAEPPATRQRVQDALAELQAAPSMTLHPVEPDTQAEHLVASAVQRLKHADFQTLSADELAQLQQHVQSLRMRWPTVAGRRWRSGARGARLDWPRVLRTAARQGGEVVDLPRQRRRAQALPVLVLLDVSGSMARYARMQLAFLHQHTPRGRRAVFAFGTHLSDLRAAFALRDSDDMLQAVSQRVADFGGGTRLGASLAALRQQHPQVLVGRRTVVLLITDGLDTGEPAALQEELQWLKRHCRSVLWLNPLLRFDGYQPLARGPQVLARFADAQVPIHNLAHLDTLAHSLGHLLKH
jgi:uncharacterized protein with von Willebrand factor type A (vWA) domain